MPVIPVIGRVNHRVSEVLDRARANLNDQAASLWTDNLLLPHLQSAYEWMFTRVAVYNPNTWRKVQGDPYDSDIIYVSGTTDLTTILPADLYLPEKLEWRVSVGTEWSTVDRVAAIPSLESITVNFPTSWCWVNRRLIMNPAQTGLPAQAHVSFALPRHRRRVERNPDRQRDFCSLALHRGSGVLFARTERTGSSPDGVERRGQVPRSLGNA